MTSLNEFAVVGERDVTPVAAITDSIPTVDASKVVDRAHDASGTGDSRGGSAAVPGYVQVVSERVNSYAAWAAPVHCRGKSMYFAKRQSGTPKIRFWALQPPWTTQRLFRVGRRLPSVIPPP